ncbi:hypothetical protein F3Y22_tig00110469pilonHSYRG00159 [Hibiscus syriacus]|uniref:Aminotransferase-like plant mobile domain-containing protein n=1 Tax=Hibiscus syriacus TaxID=106335 RepID=A0A6A3AFW3_HIBSY|nr:hypothetical protein F3Y22_tig00110469pilonHSYRG00159 [Hibiscus syriacus]
MLPQTFFQRLMDGFELTSKNEREEHEIISSNQEKQFKKLAIFAGNDFLGLSRHPTIATAMAKHGTGPRGSPLVCGHTDYHRALESALANLKKKEACLVFTSGFGANMAVMVAIVSIVPVIYEGEGRRPTKEEKVAIFSDALNHASIVDGLKLAEKQGGVQFVAVGRHAFRATYYVAMASRQPTTSPWLPGSCTEIMDVCMYHARPQHPTQVTMHVPNTPTQVAMHSQRPTRSSCTPSDLVGRQAVPATKLSQLRFLHVLPSCSRCMPTAIIAAIRAVKSAAIIAAIAQLLEDEQRVLRLRLHKVPKPHRLIEENLQEAGFWYVTFVRDYKLVPGLISALIERWRPETHTFHLSCGECTITLEDVALQLGVQTNGMPVVMSHEFNNVAQLCSLFLGKTPVPPECKGWHVRLSWLKNEFQLQPNSTEHEIIYATRAYILQLIGGILMPDKSGSYVHTQYLLFLRNFENNRQYSWGSTILAFLYREMCKASLVVNDNNTAEIGGCLLLLQSWAWHRLPFLTPISRTAVDFPLAGRWRHKIEGTGLVHNNIKEFRLKIDIKAKKVLRQFHFHQPIPRSPWDHDLLQILDGRRQVNWVETHDQLYRFDGRRKENVNWVEKHATYINAWNNRASFMPTLDGIQDDDFNFETSAYLTYFLDNGKPILTIIVERRQFLRFKKRFGKAEYSLPSWSGSSSQQPEAEMKDMDNSAPQPFGDAYIPEFVQPDASIYSPIFSSTYDFEHMSV